MKQHNLLEKLKAGGPVPYTWENIGCVIKEAIRVKADQEKTAVIKEKERQNKIQAKLFPESFVILTKLLPNIIAEENYYRRLPHSSTWEIVVSREMLMEWLTEYEVESLYDYACLGFYDFDKIHYYVEKSFIDTWVLCIPCSQFLKIKED